MMAGTVYLVFAEPVSGWHAIVYLAALIVVTIILVVIGAYIFLRVLAAAINARRDSWESIAGPLGLTIEPVGTPPFRALSGERNGRKFLVTYYGIPRGESSTYPAAMVEIKFDVPVPFAFKVEKPEMLYQKIADKFSARVETGHHFFDKAFRVSTIDPHALGRILDSQSAGNDRNLLNELLDIEKNFDRVIVTEDSVVLGRRCELGDPPPVGKTIDRAVGLADRVQASASGQKVA